MSRDELAVLDGGKCILQLRGVRPFLSEKYDLTQHPNYKLTADYDPKNTFDIEKLYTGSADKEGSLGGLVELGNIDQLIVLMKDAFQEALVCTNDPECLNNVPAGNNSNGAACHSCCMISETACENGNRMLDRGLIVPIDGRENQSYFKTLVEELCQLEV